MSSRDISLCDQTQPQASADIRLCDPAKEPRSPRDIRICDDAAECSNSPAFAYEVDSENNRMRVTSGQEPLRRILGAPCGTGEPGDTIALNQWVGLTCKCYTRIVDACGRTTAPVYGEPTNPVPTLSGPDALAVGAVYTVSNGDPTFGWSVPGGVQFTLSADTRSITITDLAGSCGGTITVTDACGRAAFKAVVVGGALTLTGTDTPSVDSQYSASGGKTPYTWSISCGTIDSTGKVTNLDGCCGSGTVTVTDACGQSASIEVRFPTGQWTTIATAGNPGIGSANPSNTACLSPFVTDGFVWSGSNWYCYAGKYRWLVYWYGCTLQSKPCVDAWGSDGACDQVHQPGVTCFPEQVILESQCAGPPCYDYRTQWSISYYVQDEWVCI